MICLFLHLVGLAPWRLPLNLEQNGTDDFMVDLEILDVDADGIGAVDLVDYGALITELDSLSFRLVTC